MAISIGGISHMVVRHRVQAGSRGVKWVRPTVRATTVGYDAPDWDGDANRGSAGQQPLSRPAANESAPAHAAVRTISTTISATKRTVPPPGVYGKRLSRLRRTCRL